MAPPMSDSAKSMRVTSAPVEPNTIVLIIEGSITPRDLDDLCGRVRTILDETHADRVVCDLAGVVEPDATTIDALARLQLTCGRLGLRITLRRATTELHELLHLAGLDEVIPRCGPLSLEVRGKAEERKQPARVQEESDPGDLSV